LTALVVGDVTRAKWQGGVLTDRSASFFKIKQSSSRLGSLIGRINPDDPNFELNLRVKQTIKINTDFIPQAELLAKHHLTSQLGGGRNGSLLQRVPLATEPGISLIILTPMKILQQNLNSSTFVV